MSRAATLLALLAVAAVGCAGSASSAGDFTSGAGGSSSSGQGASSGGCFIDKCVPPLQAPLLLAVEIDPPTSSPSAVTQILSRDVSTAEPYRAAAAVTVTTSFAAQNGGAVPSSSDVVLTVPQPSRAGPT